MTEQQFLKILDEEFGICADETGIVFTHEPLENFLEIMNLNRAHEVIEGVSLIKKYQPSKGTPRKDVYFACGDGVNLTYLS